MNSLHFPSKLLEEAVDAFAQLPGIGRKSAFRLTYALMRKGPESVERFTNALTRLVTEIKYCNVCHNISDGDTCNICANPKRDATTVCVVENMKDVISIENTSQFYGLYHVLGGVISPMEGVGPSNLEFDSLFGRVEKGEIVEIILALPTTMEGDTTSFYIYKKLKNSTVRITTISRGVSIGDNLEYTDEITLGRSILDRRPFQSTLSL